MLQHAFTAIRRHDAQTDVVCVTNAILLGGTHGAGMEGGDLVVIQIGGDKGLPGVAVGDGLDVAARQTQAIQTGRIRGKIFAHGGHNQRFAAQQLQVIGNIAGATAELTAHFWHQKGYVQDVNLFRQDVIFELILKHHNGVVGHGATD